MAGDRHTDNLASSMIFFSKVRKVNRVSIFQLFRSVLPPWSGLKKKSYADVVCAKTLYHIRSLVCVCVADKRKHCLLSLLTAQFSFAHCVCVCEQQNPRLKDKKSPNQTDSDDEFKDDDDEDADANSEDAVSIVDSER